jgi:hypothetical protein
MYKFLFQLFQVWPREKEPGRIDVFKGYSGFMIPLLISSNVSHPNLIDNHCNHHLSPDWKMTGSSMPGGGRALKPATFDVF